MLASAKRLQTTLVLLMLGTTAALSAPACSSATRESAGATRTSLPPREAVAAAALVLDVRSKEEFEQGHLANAVNVPVDEVESKMDVIATRVGGDRTRPIAVYCASGARAGRAEAALEQAGFTNVTNAGGYRDLE